MKKFTFFLASLFIAIGAMAQTTTIDVAKSYTLKCKATDHSGAIGLTDAGVIDGRSATAAEVKFEESNGGYYIKVGEKYINHTGESGLAASTEPSTAWVLGTIDNAVTFKVPETTYYLNNNLVGANGDGIVNLKANNHASGPSTSNACSIWEMVEYVAPEEGGEEEGGEDVVVEGLPTLTTDINNPVWYTISNTRSAKYITYAGDAANMTQQAQATSSSFFYFTAADVEAVDGFTAVKIHNYGTSNLLADYASWTADGAVWYITPNTQDATPAAFHITSATNTTSWNAWNDYNQSTIGSYYSQDPGSIFTFAQVTDFSAIIDVDAEKTAAKAKIENLKYITNLFADETVINNAMTEIDNVTAASNSLADLVAAVEQINSIANSVYTAVDGKNVRFTTFGRQESAGGVDITAVAAGAAETNNSGDAGIWTLKSVDGGFKMYNFIANLWMGATQGTSARIPTVATEDAAAVYTINYSSENNVNLINNGNTLHANGWGSIVQWNDNSNVASIFLVSAEPEITVTREEYTAAAEAATVLPYAIQQAYGLVTDAANYYSNYKSDDEGSYEALLDNTSSSYFHSAYGSEAGDGSGVHYIQANLGDGKSIDQFYVYMAPRTGNGNNRPVNVTVSGANSLEEEFTEIQQITTTLNSTNNPYLSAKLGTEGTNYQYIRFTVTSTNTSTVFFTLSELYLLPATSDVNTLIDAYNAYATASITSESMSEAAAALINAEGVLALSNIKKEIAVIIEANENNHAVTPELGQYSTAAYENLVAAYEATDATQETLETAVAEFNASKNMPVFTINGVISYANGTSIYDDNDGTLNFKTTNIYDKTMWWAFDQTTTEIGVTDAVKVINYATQNNFWGAESLRITETSDANENDGIFLFYTAGNNTPVHYQEANKVIVRWSDNTSDSGSAHTFTYIGNTYDLDQLTDEHITALDALQAAYNAKAHYADMEEGTGIGQYVGVDEAAITAAVTPAAAILNKVLGEQAATSVAEITAMTEALNALVAPTMNMPTEGKYYRIKSAFAAAELPGYYISGNTNADGGRIACVADGTTASTIYYYNDGKLLAYENGHYIALGSANTEWTFGNVDAAKTITFAASPRVAGAYTVKSADRYLHYKVYNGTVELDRCSEDIHANHDWTLEEVTELPVAVTAAAIATFYTPVALTIPTGVECFYITENMDENGIVNLAAIEGVVPANTGIIIKAGEGTHNFTIGGEATTNVEGNKLAGTSAVTDVPAAENTTYYVLANGEGGVGLYPATISNSVFHNNANKAYMPITVAGAGAPAFYSFNFNWGGTTGIDGVEAEGAQNSEIYDITGRKVKAITAPGIYIVNGAKVIVK